MNPILDLSKKLNPYPPGKTLEEIIDEVAYYAIKKENPVMFDTIRRLLNLGQSPKEIASCAPRSSSIKNTIIGAATYMQTHKEIP